MGFMELNKMTCDQCGKHGCATWSFTEGARCEDHSSYTKPSKPLKHNGKYRLFRQRTDWQSREKIGDFDTKALAESHKTDLINEDLKTFADNNGINWHDISGEKINDCPKYQQDMLKYERSCIDNQFWMVPLYESLATPSETPTYGKGT